MCCVIELPNQQFQCICIDFFDANAPFVSVVQSICFSSGRSTLRERVFMSHNRHVFCLANRPSPASFLKEIGSSRFRGSDGCSVRKSVWMTKRGISVKKINTDTLELLIGELNNAAHVIPPAQYFFKPDMSLTEEGEGDGDRNGSNYGIAKISNCG